MTTTQNLGPRASQLLADGHLYVDFDGTIAGIASDGVHVTMTFPLDMLESYLSEHPTPDTW